MASFKAVGHRPGVTAASNRRAVAAASVGNVLEIYDFIAYGIFAVPISETFFPPSSDFAALILTFITFAVGFLVRPVGALVLGRYADRAGRKKALSLTLLLMAAGTVVPAVCPSFASIGVAAPLIIVFGRLIQGFSAGGEIGGTVAMLVENAPSSRKGLFGSFQQMSQGGGTLIAGLVGLALTNLFTQQQIFAGAWRLAFAFGLLIGPVGWYIRRSVNETPVFEQSQRLPRRALWQQLFAYKGRVLTGVAIMVFWTIATYVSNYFTTYAVREIHLSLFDSYVGQVSYGIAMMVMCPVIGHLSDRRPHAHAVRRGAHGSGSLSPLHAALTLSQARHAGVGPGHHCNPACLLCRLCIDSAGRGLPDGVSRNRCRLCLCNRRDRVRRLYAGCGDDVDRLHRRPSCGRVLPRSRGADQLRAGAAHD